MAVSPEQIEFVSDLFADLSDITTRKMFGGLSIYQAGTIFAIMMEDGHVYLKGANTMIQTFETENWPRWSYTRKDGSETSMPYWQLPDAYLDAPDAACTWARASLDTLR